MKIFGSVIRMLWFREISEFVYPVANSFFDSCTACAFPFLYQTFLERVSLKTSYTCRFVVFSFLWKHSDIQHWFTTVLSKDRFFQIAKRNIWHLEPVKLTGEFVGPGGVSI